MKSEWNRVLDIFNRLILCMFKSEIDSSMVRIYIYLSNSFLLQATSVNIVVGSHVWIEDRVLAWIDGEVLKIDGDEVHVHTTNGKKVYFLCVGDECGRLTVIFYQHSSFSFFLLFIRMIVNILKLCRLLQNCQRSFQKILKLHQEVLMI